LDRDRVQRRGSRASDVTLGRDRRALGGRYFWVSDGLIVRDPGIDSMTGVIAGLIENGELSEIFQQVINN
jgi:hypothetical protein